MSTIPLDQFPMDEQEDFEQECARRRADSKTFSVVAEEEPTPPGGVFAIKRRVRVLHVPSGTTREYEEGGSGSHWTVDFARDLAAGVFATQS